MLALSTAGSQDEGARIGRALVEQRLAACVNLVPQIRSIYRWLKDYFDHRRALHEAEVLGQQQQVIAALIRDGFQPKEAQAVTAALLRRIAQRTADDPLLKAAAGLIGKGGWLPEL